MNTKNHLNLWYIDTGYNNHMSEDKLFSNLDKFIKIL